LADGGGGWGKCPTSCKNGGGIVREGEMNIFVILFLVNITGKQDIVTNLSEQTDNVSKESE